MLDPTASTSRGVIEAALKALGQASPSEIAQWWRDSHGDLPVTEGSIRQTLTRWAGRRYKSLPDQNGVYRMMTPDEIEEAKAKSKQRRGLPGGGPDHLGTIGDARDYPDDVIMIIDLPDGGEFWVTLTPGGRRHGAPVRMGGRLPRGAAQRTAATAEPA